MKTFNISITALAMLVLSSCGNADKSHETTPAAADTVTKAETAPEAAPEAPMDSATMAKAWENYMTPGEMHKWMASQDGKWNAEMSFWMEDGKPAGPPSMATVENKMIMGGRYQQSEYKGKMMGMDFEGHGTMAYDNARKKFLSTWIDNSGTGLMYMEGDYDPNTKTMTLTGKMVDPSTGKDCDMRQEMKAVDDKNTLITMYAKKNGKEFKNMEIRLAKK